MSDAMGDCSCWRVTSESGENHTAAWLGMQLRIAVVLRDGRRVEGRPGGPVWFQDDAAHAWQAREPGFDVELDDGTDLSIQLSEVVSITPLITPDPLWIIESLAQALRHPFGMEGGEEAWTAIAGPHEVLEVQVKVRRAPCNSASR